MKWMSFKTKGLVVFAVGACLFGAELWGQEKLSGTSLTSPSKSTSTSSSTQVEASLFRSESGPQVQHEHQADLRLIHSLYEFRGFEKTVSLDGLWGVSYGESFRQKVEQGQSRLSLKTQADSLTIQSFDTLDYASMGLGLGLRYERWSLSHMMSLGAARQRYHENSAYHSRKWEQDQIGLQMKEWNLGSKWFWNQRQAFLVGLSWQEKSFDFSGATGEYEERQLVGRESIFLSGESESQEQALPAGKVSWYGWGVRVGLSVQL